MRILVLFLSLNLLMLANSMTTDVPRSNFNLIRNNIMKPVVKAFIFGLGSSTQVLANNNQCVCHSSGTCTCPQAVDLSNYNQDYWYNPRNERIFSTAHKSYIPPNPDLYLPADLNGKNTIVIGEIHSNPCHHKLEFEVIRSLKKNKSSNEIAIGLECFYRQHQNALDRYIFGHKNMGLLKYETEWDKTWGYDLNYYAKIFNFAAVNNIRLIGLNIPIEVAKLVNQYGFDSIPSDIHKYLPEIDLTVEKHREQFESNLKKLNKNSNFHGKNIDFMYQTQTLWDEYMAESAANYINAYPSSTLVVIAGIAHVAGRVSMPDRIAKRLLKRKDPFVIVPQSVEWSKEYGLPLIKEPLTASDCDWAWYTEKALLA